MSPSNDNSKWIKFYYDFAAAYGTLWLICFVLAIVTQSHIDTGQFGVFGFPIISVIFAITRRDNHI